MPGFDKKPKFSALLSIHHAQQVFFMGNISEF